MLIGREKLVRLNPNSVNYLGGNCCVFYNQERRKIMSIKHAELRPEVLTLVRSNLAKYDPNNNGVVDDGDELSQLLSEYQTQVNKLTEGRGTILTNHEKSQIDKFTEADKEAMALIGGAGGFIALLALLIAALIRKN